MVIKVLGGIKSYSSAIFLSIWLYYVIVDFLLKII